MLCNVILEHEAFNSAKLLVVNSKKEARHNVRGTVVFISEVNN